MLLFAIGIALGIVSANPVHSGVVQMGPNLGISGGDIAVIEDYPYEVIIEFGDEMACAGSIVSDHYVVTAGLCVRLVNNETVIRAGSSSRGVGGSIHKIDKTIVHPEKPDEKFIALIRVVEPFQYDRTVKPIPLFDQDKEISVGKKGIVSGWGNTKPGKTYKNDQFYKIEMTILDDDICEKARNGYHKGKFICAMNVEEKGKDVCLGDWADPLVIDEQLAGIVLASWRPCTGEGPSVYANIAHYRNWIDDNVQ